MTTERIANETSTKITELNDAFRKANPAKFFLTKGISNLPGVSEIIEEVQSFNNFTEDNDPYGEHDFGSLVWENQKIFWKIDYYDPSFELWCDPLHPECNRVLTVMLAEEY